MSFYYSLPLYFGGGGGDSLSAQLTSSGASCVDFEYACGGGDAFFPNSQVDVTCGRSTRTYDIPGLGNEICWQDLLCPGKPSACLNYKNWHFCPGTSGSVYQELPRNSSINGTILGNFPLEDWNGNVACVGRNYFDFNNSVNSATELNICPGDPAKLKVPGLEFPVGYAGRLEFNIRRVSNNSLVYFDIFLASDIDANDEIDISLPFNFLSSDLYVFELILACFGQAGCATTRPNRVKKTYVEVKNVVFDAQYQYAVQGNIFNPNCPEPVGLIGDEPDGLVIPLQPCNLTYQLLLSNIENAGGEGITVEYFFKNCSSSGGFTPFATVNIPAAQVATGFASMGTVPNLSPPTGCLCYRLDIEFFDLCIDDFNTTSKYYRIGPDCPEDFTGPGGPIKLGTNNEDNNFENPIKPFELYPNPIEDFISIQWKDFESSEFNLLIYNGSGKVVQEIKVEAANTASYRQDINLPAGAYYYNIIWKKGTQSGTFIKR
jgi:hypothetical protein